jgi:hypothetical protein
MRSSACLELKQVENRLELLRSLFCLTTLHPLVDFYLLLKLDLVKLDCKHSKCLKKHHGQPREMPRIFLYMYIRLVEFSYFQQCTAISAVFLHTGSNALIAVLIKSE